MKKSLIVILLVALSVFSVPAQSAQSKTGGILRSGPMLGYSEMTETLVWLQTREPASVEIRYWKQGEPKNVKIAKAIRTTEESDHIARFKISQLEFGTRYDYDVYINGRKQAFDFQPSFQSQPHWRWAKNPPEQPAFKFAIGSCAYINDTKYDRPGRPYGAGFEVFRAIAVQKPDFMIWLGDNIYYREPDWLTESAMRYRYAQNRELPELQPLLATTHHYAIWDDHDYGPNDSDRTYRLRDTALEVFKDYWGNNTYGTSEIPGVFGRFEWGDVEFFLLDGRYHRTPNRMPDAPDKVMFGDAQMKWLMESLRSSNATFKVIAGGNQMINPITPWEAFGRFPNEQKKLFEFIRDQRIEGVMFLSGDRHLTELIKRTDLGTYPLYDFTSSPLASGNAKPHESEANNPARVPNTLVTEAKNFGLIELSGTGANRKMTLKTIDLNGKELWKHDVLASELKFPRN